MDGSELPFRQVCVCVFVLRVGWRLTATVQLCRNYGVQLCYSPMVQASILRTYYRAHKSYDLVFHTERTSRRVRARACVCVRVCKCVC